MTRMEQDPYHRPLTMRRFWRWYPRMFLVALLAAFGLNIWCDSDWYLIIPVMVIVVLLLHLHYFVRCSRRLRPRVVKERWRSGYRRYLYDCLDCQVTWDSSYIEEPESL